MTVLERCEKYHKKPLDMSGPQVEDLIGSGRLVTPFSVRILNSRNFPLANRRDSFTCAVMVPIGLLGRRADFKSELGEMDLTCPTPDHAIRFVSQIEPADKLKPSSLILFPSDPPFSVGVRPKAPSWFVAKWSPAKSVFELRMYMIERAEWPENTVVVGMIDLV